MAWLLRITEVSGNEIQMIGEPPVATPVDITPTGHWRVNVEYFDEAAPQTVLHEEEFIFQSAEVNTTQALARAQELGRKIRDTRTLVTELQQFIGTSFPLE